MKRFLPFCCFGAALIVCLLPMNAQTPLDTPFTDEEEIENETEREEEDDTVYEDTAAPKEQKEDVPEWLAQLSNLPREQRDEYIQNFTLAKQALNTGNWVACDAALTSCEFIFNKNPHIHNLRIVCYIEQKRMESAAEEMEKALKILPNDPTTLVNLATLRMAQKDYRGCIKEMTDVLENRQTDIKQEVRDILIFRIFLCHLMLGEVTQAEEWVSELSPISDTPLFYYSRAALCLYLKDAPGAQQDLQSAANIFAAGGLLVPYQRALLSCDLTEAKH